MSLISAWIGLSATRRHGQSAGQGGQAEFHALAGYALGLPVQRLMLPVLVEQRPWPEGLGPAQPRGMGWNGAGGWLIFSQQPAGELLTHRLDHLPLSRDDLQRLGDVFAHLHDAIRAATRAGWSGSTTTRSRGRCSGNGLRRACGDAEPRHGAWSCRQRCLSRPTIIVLGGRGFEFLELQLHLIDQPRTALRAVMPYCSLRSLAISSFGDSLIIAFGGETTARLRQFASAVSARAFEAASSARNLAIRKRHLTWPRLPRWHWNAHENRCFKRLNYPAFAGRWVQRGLRQSIPSRRYPAGPRRSARPPVLTHRAR